MGLENFRSFKTNTSIQDLSSISVLIGPNNVGKSNIIKALKWYRNMGLTSTGMQEFQGMKVMVENASDLLHSTKSSKYVNIEIEFQLDELERKSLMDMILMDESIRGEIEKSQLFRRINHTITLTENSFLYDEKVRITNMYGSWLPLFGNKHVNGGIESWTTNFLEQVTKLSNTSDLIIREKSAGKPPKSQNGFLWENVIGIGRLERGVSFEGTVAGFILESIKRWYSIDAIRYLIPTT